MSVKHQYKCEQSRANLFAFDGKCIVKTDAEIKPENKNKIFFKNILTFLKNRV